MGQLGNHSFGKLLSGGYFLHMFFFVFYKFLTINTEYLGTGGGGWWDPTLHEERMTLRMLELMRL